MPNSYLIVVDMQNDFIDGALGTPEAQDVYKRQMLTRHGVFGQGETPGMTAAQRLQSPFEYDHVLQLNPGLNDGAIVILDEEVRQHMRTREAARLVKGNG